MAICARRSLSMETPGGRNRGSMTEAMKRTEINGTPRINSMYAMESQRTNGMLERRPSAKNIDRGHAPSLVALRQRLALCGDQIARTSAHSISGGRIFHAV